MRFRKRPVVVEAFRTEEWLEINTPEGVMRANPGDWVVTGTAGETYPVKPEIFATIYEPVEDDTAVLTNAAIDAGMLEDLRRTLARLQGLKPLERSERARHWAVAITEMEKVIGYFKTFVFDEDPDC
jgi:hypothetical protein